MGRHINKYTVGVCIFVAVGAWTYGFAFAIFIQAIGEPGFYVYFNLDPDSAYTASIEGAVNALFAAGCAFGCIMQGLVGDWLGRKRTIIISQLLALIGGALCAGAVNVAMLVSTRFIQGLGLGQSLTLVSLYITEVANKNNRGLLNGLTACGLATGYVVVQFRLLLALGVVGPIITLAGIYWVPESPRWLAWQGRRDEAWEVLRKLHYDPVDDPNEEASQAEFQQIVLQVEHDKKENVTFLKMFTVPSWRRRSLTAMFLLYATQCTGILAIGNYQLLLYDSLGLTDWLPLLFYCFYTLIGTAPNFLSSALMDRLGRRTLLLTGYIVLTVMLIIEMVLQKYYVSSTNKAGTAATVAFLWIYVGCYGFFIDPPQFVYVSEIFPTTLRAKGVALGFASYFLGAITFTTPAATAARTIGWKMYLVYVGLNVISIGLIYWFVPETKNLSLEEIGELFGDEVVVHLSADGHHVVEAEKVDVTLVENKPVATA
ncbi:hypothetical protein SEUCBS139899_009775 [Sporothrix eucalyptigena]